MVNHQLTGYINLQAFCDLRQLSHHIHDPGTIVLHVAILSHKQVVRAYMKIAGHGDNQIDRWLSLSAFHLAEMLQTDIQSFSHFLLSHSLSFPVSL